MRDFVYKTRVFKHLRHFAVEKGKLWIYTLQNPPWAGHDGIPAQTQSTGLTYKPKDRNTLNLVFQSLNLQKSGRWMEN